MVPGVDAVSYHQQLGEALVVLFPAAVPLVDYRVQNDGGSPFIAAWSLPNPQPTEAEVAAAVPQIPAAYDTAQKTGAKDAVDSDYAGGRVTRAQAQLIIDELNIVRKWITDFKVEVAAAASLADLKTRVAAIQPLLPPRTLQQAINAIKGAIDGEN